MTLFPLNLAELLGQYGAYIVFLIIGFGFGYALEISGFGNSKKLAAQFYFKEMTVLKVMFTAIIVAMVGIFLSTAVGLLDYNMIWVNPTYLWPGIIGGLIMGVGFIVGGFCPGTSLVAVATAKIDGIFFSLGVLFGIFVFGETIDNFTEFFNSSFLGRFTLQDWFGVDAGWVVLGVVLMAIFMFWGSEKLEDAIGGMNNKRAPKLRLVGAGILILIAVVTIIIGQPTSAEKWDMISDEKETLLVEDRAYQIHPRELLGLMDNDLVILHIIDVRSEADFNTFHLENAVNIQIDDLKSEIPNWLLEPSHAVFVLVGNHEDISTDGWKILVAENVNNVYLLEGGLNYWLNVFSAEEGEEAVLNLHVGEDDMHHMIEEALGHRHDLSSPDPDIFEIEFIPKVKLEIKKGPLGGGCG
jgi:rhodanese-related sulfurtransferase